MIIFVRNFLDSFIPFDLLLSKAGCKSPLLTKSVRKVLPLLFFRGKVRYMEKFITVSIGTYLISCDLAFLFYHLTRGAVKSVAILHPSKLDRKRFL